MTKKYKTLSILFLVFSLLLNLVPIIVYSIEALGSNGVIVEKVTFCLTVFVVLILSAVAWINKTTMKSRVWIIMLGLYVCLDHFIGPLLIIGITQILDEWIASPLRKHYKNKYVINKELDNRL